MIEGKRKSSPMRAVGIGIISVILFFQLSWIAFPQEREEEFLPPMGHPLLLVESNLYDGRTLLELKDKIGLTREQEEKIENLMLGHEAFSIRNSSEIKVKELQLAAFLESKGQEMNRKEMENHIREIEDMKTNMIIHYMNYLLDLREILTAKQLEILKQTRERGESRK